MKKKCPQCGAEQPATEAGETIQRCQRCGALLSDVPQKESSTIVVGGGQAPFPSGAVVGSTEVLSPHSTERVKVARPASGGTVLDFLTRDPASRHVKIAILAQGGQGSVFEARDVNIRRRVAMKVLQNPGSAPAEEILRFVHEAQITGQLEHPSVVPLYDLGLDAEGNVYYTMKYVRGASLKDIIKKIREGDPDAIRQYPLSRLLIIFQKLCDAVAFAHSRRVIHRDLKPENIMVGEYGEVLVTDWGLAKALPHKPSSTRETGATDRKKRGEAGVLSKPASEDEANRFVAEVDTIDGTIMGTPGFMPPEQAMGKMDELDERADIYAMGAILYNLLTLHLPVAGQDLDELIRKTVEGKITDPSTYEKGPLPHCPGGRMPQSLVAVAMKALSFNPEDRYRMVKEMQRDIEAYQTGFAVSVEEAGPLKQLALFVRRNMAASITAALAVVLIAILTGWYIVDAARQRRFAEQALAELRGTAPDLIEAARGYVNRQEFEEALKRIQFAISLEPGRSDYLVAKGHVLQTLLRFEEAERAYEAALAANPTDQIAKENLELTRRIRTKTPADREPEPSALAVLALAMRSQGRYSEALAILRRFSGKQETLDGLYWEMLARMDLPYRSASVMSNGLCELDISAKGIDELDILKNFPLGALVARHNPIETIAPLRGMSLEKLDISETHVRDLSPLKGMPLKWLAARETPIVDLAPLRGSEVIHLDIADTRVADLTALKGMKLEFLDISRTQVEDLSPLADMPLRAFRAEGCLRVKSWSPVAKFMVESHSFENDQNLDQDPD